MLRGKISRMFSKAAVGVAALAMVCAMVPMAMATPTATDANAADDVCFTVEWTATDGTACSAEVDATALADNDVYAAIYSSGRYSVIGTNNSVAVGDIIENASYYDREQDETYWASAVWNEDATLTVCTTDYPDGYGDYSYSDMMADLPFYGESTSSAINKDVVTYRYAARVGLSYISTSISGTAAETVAGMNFATATNSTRLVFGYTDTGTAGSLFPKYVSGFKIK